MDFINPKKQKCSYVELKKQWLGGVFGKVDFNMSQFGRTEYSGEFEVGHIIGEKNN